MNLITFFKQKAIFLLLLFSLLFSAIIVSSVASAQIYDDPSAKNYGLDETLTGNEGNKLENDKALIDDEPEKIAGNLIGVLLTWSGVIFMFLIFMGGLTWMLAQGNEQQVEKAKQIIIAAVFGLMVVLSAYALTAFIGKTFIP